ncbi:MAG: phosphatase PAP2 family protein [Blautia sp.]|nr:phosphatase PAP2 family protein [Blautia sp.]
MRKRIFNRREKWMLLAALVSDLIAYYLGRLLSANRYHYDFTTSLDRRIPMVSWMIVIYVGCYVFWVVNYAIAVKAEEKESMRFLTAHIIGETVCFLCFVMLPTTMQRPEITGTTFFENLMQYIYRLDSPDNLLPSIHCFASWMCWIGVRKHKKVPKWYRYASLIIAAAVCISTLTVKQHILWDVIAGVALAEASYSFAGCLLKRHGFRKQDWKTRSRQKGGI